MKKFKLTTNGGEALVEADSFNFSDGAVEFYIDNKICGVVLLGPSDSVFELVKTSE